MTATKMNGFTLTRRASLALLAGLMFAAPALAHEFKAGDLLIQHPWSRETVPGAKVGAGYFTVVNSGSQADRLVSASVDPAIADRAEIHDMTMNNGVMSMRAVEGGLEVPAGGQLALQPSGSDGGYHLMIIGLKAPLKKGVKFKATLTFEKAGAVPVEFLVQSKADDHKMHDMGAMNGG